MPAAAWCRTPGVTGSARLAPPQPGNDPVDLLTLSERELLGIRGEDIAMIFQEPMTALNPLYTVGDQIAEVLELKQGLTQAPGLAGRHRGARRHRHSRAGAARRRPSRTSSRAASASAP